VILPFSSIAPYPNDSFTKSHKREGEGEDEVIEDSRLKQEISVKR
jgi:hypothetical protein